MVKSCSMKNVTFAISFILLPVAVSLAQSLTPAPENTGKLKGVIEDWQYARVLGSCLTIKNKTLEKKVMVDTNGAFEVELPVGIYQVTAQSPRFRQYHWKELRIEPNATKTLNIMLKIAPEKAGCLAGTKRNEKGKLPICINLCET